MRRAIKVYFNVGMSYSRLMCEVACGYFRFLTVAQQAGTAGRCTKWRRGVWNFWEGAILYIWFLYASTYNIPNSVDYTNNSEKCATKGARPARARNLSARSGTPDLAYLFP